MMRRALLVVTALLAIAAVAAGVRLAGESDSPGGPPDRAAPPYSKGIEVGEPYDYVVDTHCGVVWATIDGTTWKADPPLTDGNGNPPPGWGGGGPGTLEVVTEDRAVFRGDPSAYGRNDLIATFVRSGAPADACIG